jgi:hypothetical protein
LASFAGQKIFVDQSKSWGWRLSGGRLLLHNIYIYTYEARAQSAILAAETKCGSRSPRRCRASVQGRAEHDTAMAHANNASSSSEPLTGNNVAAAPVQEHSADMPQAKNEKSENWLRSWIRTEIKTFSLHILYLAAKLLPATQQPLLALPS